MSVRQLGHSVPWRFALVGRTTTLSRETPAPGTHKRGTTSAGQTNVDLTDGRSKPWRSPLMLDGRQNAIGVRTDDARESAGTSPVLQHARTERSRWAYVRLELRTKKRRCPSTTRSLDGAAIARRPPDDYMRSLQGNGL